MRSHLPTDANVIYAYSGVKGAQPQQVNTMHGDGYGKFVPGQIPSTGPTLAAGVWIAYMMADGTTNAGAQLQAPSSGAPRLRNKQLRSRPKLHRT